MMRGERSPVIMGAEDRKVLVFPELFRGKVLEPHLQEYVING
jgi:hypothetical protein